MNPLFTKRVHDTEHDIGAVMKVETNKIINGVEFSKKREMFKTNHGEPVRNFFSRVNSLYAEN